MKTLYTAVGRFERRERPGGLSYPIVVINRKEFAVDIQEMILWTILNWRILDIDTLSGMYYAKERKSGFLSRRSMDICLSRLLQRGLVAEGTGDTDEQALYNLLADLYIIPISENPFLRLVSFVKLTVFHNIPLSFTKNIFASDRRSEDEKKVIRLSRQTLMSTAEIIKCMEKKVLDLPSEKELLETLYADEYTTSDNIADIVRSFESCRPVLLSVSNLYLRCQIIFERI